MLPPWCGVYHLVYHMVVWCNDGLPPPPGWHIGVPFCGPRMSPTPRSAKYGATHSANRLPGLEITSPLVIICRRRSGSDGIPSLVQRIYLIYCKKCALLARGQGTEIHPL